MALTETHPRAVATRSRVITAAALAALLVLVGFLAGRSWQQNQSTLGGWHTARGYVGAQVMTIEYDGWSYGARVAVPSWIDAAGSWHEAGWPDCLNTVGEEKLVRFQATEVTVDDITSRPIIAVDCRTDG